MRGHTGSGGDWWNQGDVRELWHRNGPDDRTAAQAIARDSGWLPITTGSDQLAA
ncbi:hypothetical protein [Nocardia sp. NPDC004711]